MHTARTKKNERRSLSVPYRGNQVGEFTSHGNNCGGGSRRPVNPFARCSCSIAATATLHVFALVILIPLALTVGVTPGRAKWSAQALSLEGF